MIPTHCLPSNPDQRPDFNREPVIWTSPDGSATLYLSVEEMDFYIETFDYALPHVVDGFLAYALRMGYMPLDYEECPPELMSNGAARLWLCPVEPISDVDWEMPSMIPVGSGPFSMEIPVVDPRGVVMNYEVVDNTQGIPVVKLDTPPPVPSTRSGGKHRA